MLIDLHLKWGSRRQTHPRKLQYALGWPLIGSTKCTFRYDTEFLTCTETEDLTVAQHARSSARTFFLCYSTPPRVLRAARDYSFSSVWPSRGQSVHSKFHSSRDFQLEKAQVNLDCIAREEEEVKCKRRATFFRVNEFGVAPRRTANRSRNCRRIASGGIAWENVRIFPHRKIINEISNWAEGKRHCFEHYLTD